MKLGRFVREEKWVDVVPKKQMLERQSVDDRYNFGGASGHRSFDFTKTLLQNRKQHTVMNSILALRRGPIRYRRNAMIVCEGDPTDYILLVVVGESQSLGARGDRVVDRAAKITEKAYVAKCRAEAAKPAAAAPATAPVAPTAAAKPAPAATKKPTDGRQAEYARERACGGDWKADKAANKVPAGMTWPKYWSECNKRKKAAGM